MRPSSHNEEEKPKLLVVDDEPDMLDFLERVFRGLYRVTCASSAAAARRALSEEMYDALVTDHKMPRSSGIELIAWVHDRQPRMARVLISGFTDAPDVQTLIAQERLDSYVVKPVDSEQLREVVKQALARKRGA